MKEEKNRPKIVIACGFDRCGSSMIARLLATHPGVNLFFQPFNSTEIHKAQWEVWDPSKRAVQTEAFLENLLAGTLDKGYIASDWFSKYSSSEEVNPDQVNLIKDTKFHFKLGWLKAKYPAIEVFGIWRDPRGITCSLMRNRFNEKWYGDVPVEKIKAIINQSPLMEEFGSFLMDEMAEYERMAVLVAIRTRLLLEGVPPGNWLFFENIIEDPTGGLSCFLKFFGLKPFKFPGRLKKDYNVSGKPFVAQDFWQEYFSRAEKKRLDEIFASVLKMKRGQDNFGEKAAGDHV